MPTLSPRRWFSRLILPVLVALAAACSSTPPPDAASGIFDLRVAHPESQRVPGWLELRDLSVHVASERTPPTEPFIRGWWTGESFDATEAIVGAVGPPPRGRNTTRGRVELRSHLFFRRDDARPIIAPYIEGARDDDSGAFFPNAAVAWSTP